MTVTPLKLIASQLADLEPYRGSPGAREELFDAAEAHDRRLREIQHSLSELRREVTSLKDVVRIADELNEQAAHVAIGASIPEMNIHAAARALGPLVNAYDAAREALRPFPPTPEGER